ncbi:unnamed protein product [Strongylus vulgaris]|uniref:Uncharacterized protein n=1 Tax=Strongylus vulgaris TaxID=40348 RepID=A0A3P7JK90_STRVU|nr:unnamed protein product [Strongylus vulgaris]
MVQADENSKEDVQAMLRKYEMHRRALLKHVLAPSSAQQEEEMLAKRRRQEEEKKTEESKKTLLEKHAELKEHDATVEIAQGVQYTESFKTSWRPPSHIRNQTEEDFDAFRKRRGITVDGLECPPPIGSFLVRF